MTERKRIPARALWMHARCAYIRELVAEGDSFENIARTLFCDPGQAQLLSMTDPDLILEPWAELRQAQAGGWTSVSDSLPDSDVWVLVCGPEADYVVVQLEFTDDSEGRGEPYWAAGEGELALGNYPHWLALPNPPECS